MGIASNEIRGNTYVQLHVSQSLPKIPKIFPIFIFTEPF
uniref:Uncharacterized protein n=1 Tax=Rhizophora mucronata TaxID=61149 RepID=A0A2P2PCS6_RHIMU